MAMQAFAYPTSPVPGYRKSGQELCDLEWPTWSGILISSSSQPWVSTPWSSGRVEESPGSFGQPIWMLQLLLSPSLLLPRGCVGGHSSAEIQSLRWGTELWHQTKPSAWPRFRMCLGRTLGQRRCLILMGIACTEAWGPQPCISFSHVLGQIRFLISPSKALRQDKGLSRQGSSGPRLSLGLSFDDVWHCSRIQARRRRKCWDSWSEAMRLGGWPLQLGPEVEVKGGSILLFGVEEGLGLEG
ncbi:hypothetical protein Nmel_010354 [Mimus melanotis]